MELQARGLSAEARSKAAIALGVVACALPLVGLLSLVLRKQIDPHIENYSAHFLIFGLAGGLAFGLGFAAGEAAERRSDARVLLLSLAFMTTGGFMLLHALGTHQVLFETEHPGFKVALSTGLLVSAVFASASAFVDLRPELGPWLIRNRGYFRGGILFVMAVWFTVTVLDLPPLDGPHVEAARSSMLATLAFAGTLVYAISAFRYWQLFRRHRKLLLGAVTACFVLLAEAMIGVALTGERAWHASWWEWHGLIVSAYLVIGIAAQREWRDERFRDLYLPSTRERKQYVSVLFGDLAGFTTFSERATPTDVAKVLDAYWSAAAPLITRRYRARSRSSSATASPRRSTAAATSPTTRPAPLPPRSPCRRRSRGSGATTPTGRRCGSASTAARSSSARSAAPATSLTPCSATPSTPAHGSKGSRRRAGC